MSRYTTWALRICADGHYVFSPATNHVLLALAAHASRTGAAWPSVATLARETGRHPETVRRALAILADQRDPATRKHLFADVSRPPGQVAIWQFPAPEPPVTDRDRTAEPPVIDSELKGDEVRQPPAEGTAKGTALDRTNVLTVEIKTSAPRFEYFEEYPT